MQQIVLIIATSFLATTSIVLLFLVGQLNRKRMQEQEDKRNTVTHFRALLEERKNAYNQLMDRFTDMKRQLRDLYES